MQGIRGCPSTHDGGDEGVGGFPLPETGGIREMQVDPAVRDWRVGGGGVEGEEVEGEPLSRTGGTQGVAGWRCCPAPEGCGRVPPSGAGAAGAAVSHECPLLEKASSPHAPHPRLSPDKDSKHSCSIARMFQHHPHLRVLWPPSTRFGARNPPGSSFLQAYPCIYLRAQSTLLAWQLSPAKGAQTLF